MSIRQRQMYETAFDSRVKREVYDIDRLAQSPVLQHEPVVRHRIGSGSGLRPRLGTRGVPGSSKGSSANSSPRDSRESPRHRSMTVQHFTPTEKRKVTLIRDSPRSLSPQPQKIKVNDAVRPTPPTDISWMAENSARSRSNVSQGKQSHKNITDATNQVSNPGSSEGFSNGFQVENGSEKKTFSPTTEFKKLDILTAYESDSVPNSDGLVDNISSASKESIGNFAVTSTEPYRQPMKDHANLPCPNGLLSSLQPSLSLNTNPFRLSSSHALRHNGPNSTHQFQTPMDAPSFSSTGQMSNGTTNEGASSNSSSVKRQVPAVKSSGVPARPNLSLNFNSSPKRARQHLSLNFGCAALNVIGEAIDPGIPLEKQGWYHGSISRLDAENVIRLLKEGSYLVRNCESSRHDYFLSLKSARGFMHMKIVSLDGKYILGQGNQPFDSIPCMVHYYSIHRLPIKGAEHMVLLHPVMDQLL